MISILDEITRSYESISRIMSIVSANTVRATAIIQKHIGSRPKVQIDSGYHELSSRLAIGSPAGGSIEMAAGDDGSIEIKTANLPWITFEFNLQSGRRGEAVLEAVMQLPVITSVEMFTRVFTSAATFEDRGHTRRLVESDTLMVCTFDYAPLPEPNVQKLILMIPNPPAHFRISRLASLVMV